MAILDAMADPRSFFEQRENDLSLLVPAGIVLVVTMISTGSGYLQFQAITAALPPEAEQFAQIVMFGSLVGGFVGSFVGWLVLAVVFYALASLVFDGDGSFGETLAVTGWGYAPKVVGALITLAVTYYVFVSQGVSPPDVSDQQAVQQYVQSLQTDPLLLGTSLVSILITLWSAYIWTKGVSVVHDIDTTEAAISVGVPVALSVAMTAFNLITSFTGF